MTDAIERDGLASAAAALVLATGAAVVIAVTSWSEIEVAARLALTAVVVLALALVVGSGWLVAFATLPFLGAALMAGASRPDPTWVQSMLVGCLWYVAVELAWAAIEQRAHGRRSGELRRVRIHEITTVVAASLSVTTLGLVAAEAAPARDLVAQASIVGAILVALALGIRQLRRPLPPLDAGE